LILKGLYFDEGDGNLRKVLVTGGAGLIGSHLVRLLVEKGHRVFIIDNFERGSRENLEDIQGSVQVIECDLRDQARTEMIIGKYGFDDVYHLAARLGGVGYVTDHPAECFTPNLQMNVNVLEACRKAEIDRLLFTSTACIYPVELQERPDAPALREVDDCPYNPEFGYGWAKLITEHLCNAYIREYGMKISIVRMFNVYGPGEDMGEDSHVIPMLIRKAIRYPEEEFVVWGSGDATRAFTFVSDAAAGLILTMEKGINNGPYNIGGHETVSIRRLAEMIKEISGKKDMPIVFDASRPEGVSGRAADWTKAREELGWNPHISLEEGLRITYEWAEKKLKKHGYAL